MSTEICDERHKNINKELDHVNERLDKHDDKINDITNLTRSIKAQTNAIWGLVLTMGTGLVGFFFFAVEKGLFK